TTGDQFDITDASVNLGPLASNGGPTQTRALLPGSIALDQGHSSGASVDQRGLTRPCDNAGIVNAAGGDGGDVGAFEERVLCATGSAPDAVDDAASVAQDSGANAIDVLANDTDADGDALAIVAVTQGAHGSVAFSAGSVSYTPNAGFVGGDSFTYTIDDGHSGNDTATVTVMVTDTQPPVITASVAVPQLWSPTNKLVDVALSFNAVDNSSGVTTQVVVYSDEAAGKDDDAVGMLQLRAQREGSGDGRVYLIRISATDAFSNTSHRCLTVVVPKSMSAADVASVNAQAAAAQAQCTGAGMSIM
ncbi:MAG: Ig-like domain-containing protein, partial [Thermoanaerobaculia bacterium]